MASADDVVVQETPDENDNQCVKTINTDSGDESGSSIITYSSEDLFNMRTSSSSSIWPTFLDETFKNSRGNWDPDRWHQSRKPPSEDAKKKDEDRPNSSLSTDCKRPLKDPKERLKAESQEGGLVLGPRGRSFNTGCQIAQPSQIESKEKENFRLKEIKELKERVAARNRDEPRAAAHDSRRVGSGRVLNRERDEFESSGGRRFERGNGGGEFGYRKREDDYDQRRGEGGWYEGGVGSVGRHGNRYDEEYRQRGHRGGGRGRGHRQEEPEWMSAPVDRDELMELRGFDDSPGKEPSAEHTTNEEAKDNMGDVLGEVLHLDSIPGLSSLLEDEPRKENAKMPEAGNGGSRFSQFFKQPASELPQNENAKHLLQQQIRIPSPGDPSACFAPISPAAQTTTVKEQHQQQQQQQSDNPLMDMLRGTGPGAPGKVMGLPPMPPPPDLGQLQGKNVKSVEELEADMKRFGRFPSGEAMKHPPPQFPPPQHPVMSQEHSEGDMSAFNKFAAMVEMNKDEGFSGNRHRMLPPNFQLRQPGGHGLVRPMPSHRGGPDEDIAMPHRQPPPHQGVPPPGAMPPPPPGPRPPFPSEAQIQQGMLVLIHRAPMNMEILKHQEARSLQACLDQGNVTPTLLLHQFIHGNLTAFHREILLNILKVAQLQGQLGPIPDAPRNASPRTSPLPDPFLMLMNQQSMGSSGAAQPPQPPQRVSPRNTLAVSPLPGQQRVPSPQELVIHTQQIMQNALIKRKLKEQEESYRKRMEQSKAEFTDGAPKSSDSPTSLAFAPTAVMKKMAADRRDSDPKLLKGNPTIREPIIGPHGDGGRKEEFGRISPNKFIDQISAHQHMPPMPPMPPNANIAVMQQLRTQQQMQQLPIGMDPRFIHPRHPSGGFPSQQPGFGSRSPSNMLSGGPTGGQGLSRFFSPEVLAQANTGGPSLPPLPTQKAMTLEEIERKAAAVRI